MSIVDNLNFIKENGLATFFGASKDKMAMPQSVEM